jgi:hypothetical protein
VIFRLHDCTEDATLSRPLMSGKSGAYESKAADTDFRKKWDKEEYAERAKKKDDEERERMQENEERMKQGKPYNSFFNMPMTSNIFAIL